MKKKVSEGILLIAVVFLMCRCCILEYSFPIGIAVVTYAMSIKIKYGYIVAVPIIPAIATRLPEGYDVIGYIIGVAICLIVFIVLQKVELYLWQRGIIAGAVNIIVICIYSLLAGVVYKLSVQRLICESITIIALVILFDIIAGLFVKGKFAERGEPYIGGAFTVVGVLSMSGAEAGFLIWPLIIAAAMFFLVYRSSLEAFIIISFGALAAEIAGEGNFGAMANLVMAVSIAGAFGKRLKSMIPIIFTVVCICFGMIDCGIILKVDSLTVVIPAIIMLILILKNEKLSDKILNLFNGYERRDGDEKDMDCLKQKAADMENLARLYDSYIDSRAILADQFKIMKQLLEDSRRSLRAAEKKSLYDKKDKLKVDIAMAQCAATGNICGDCCGWQDIGENRVAMVISDGMGKGKKAASESLMVTKTMLLLLKSAVTVDLVLKLINSVMIMKNDEDSYATLDMAIIDKITGKAKIYKIGAAPTLIRRGSEVEEVELSTVPLGVVNGIKVEYVETSLKEGDWLVMMSDGVSDGGNKKTNREANELLGKIKKILQELKSKDSETAAEVLLSFAADSYAGRERDDLTVMVARLV